MAKLRVKFTFPPEQMREPVIYEVGKRFDLVTNIRRADITAEVAWAILELDGEQRRPRCGHQVGRGAAAYASTRSKTASSRAKTA